jgi:malate dehydrogenase
MGGEKNVVEPSYVESDVVPGLSFFSTKIELSPHGVGKIHPIGEMSAYEAGLLEAAKPELAKNIKNGVDFVAKQ